MHILLDGRAILNEIDGIGRYSINLIREIISSGEDIIFTVLIREDLSPDLRKEFPASANLITTKMSHISIHGMFFLGRMIDKMKADIYHCMFTFKPLSMKTLSVITVHDLMWVRRPWLQASGNPLRQIIGWIFNAIFATASVKSARKIIAVSEATKREIFECWRNMNNKVHVIGEGVDPCFYIKNKAEKDKLIMSSLGLPERPFFLHMSNGKPYKNTLRLLKAFSNVSKTDDIILVIIGRRSAFSHHIEECIKKSNIGERIYFLGNLKNQEVVSLMQEAEAMLFPSLYEGFGLPVIEAMACGCPVMTSDRGALREVAGNAALLIDPENIHSMVSGMKSILYDKKLIEEIRRKGNQRALNFRWSKIAKQIIHLYREIINNENIIAESTFS